MTKAGYEAYSGSVTLTASTAKTCLMLITPAQFGLDLKKFRVSFDGITPLDPSVLIELVTSTNATNSTPGTNNTSVTPSQAYGRSITTGFTAFAASTTEPTVLSVFEGWTQSPYMSNIWYDWPLGDTPDFAVSVGIGFRLTPGTLTATTHAHITAYFERC